MRPREFFPILLISMFFTGCGYQVVGIEKPASYNISSVAIPIFDNRTTEPQIEFIFTEALRREFLKRGGLKLTSIQEADVVFRGKIIRIFATDVAHNRFNQTVESRFFVTVDIRCEDRRTGTILWQDNQLTFSRSYPYGKTTFDDYQARRTTIEYIAKRVAERVYDRFMTKRR
ncbi:MAG: LPS assembly lipoprotein LptE [Syntrophobacterales bacterium]|nr:LPS assembly lipoprotein LptE [Syntrophobacterales bacterium]